MSNHENHIEHANRHFAMQQARALEIGNRPLSERKKDLKRLLSVLMKYRDAIADAVKTDLNKPKVESDLSEVFPIKSDIKHALSNIDEWASRKDFSTPLQLLGTKAWAKPEPKGVVLIISPWNFPFNLTFGPLVSALAAGNTAVLKPSESTPTCAALMAKMVSEIFDPDHVVVLEGGPELSSHLVSLPFNHIFFTGGPQIGKKVLRAAAEHLTPVTLELGGKSPAIVDHTANLNDAVSRIVWARYFNSGQVCISPDYALVEKAIAEPFVAQVVAQIKQFYGDGMANTNLSMMVHEQHFDKVVALINDAIEKGAEVVTGGRSDRSRCFIEPTVLTKVTPEMAIMNEEIFGPVLPILIWNHPDEAIRQIHALERPLAYYVFSKSKPNVRRFVNESRAGSTAINETFVQFTHPELPFGGINFSGMGKAHGKYGFDTFSNKRSFVKQRFRLNAPKFVHPPYAKFTQKLADTLIRWF